MLFLLYGLPAALAQHSRGQTVVSLGASVSPGINLMIDHALSDRLSLGPCVSHTFFSRGMMRDNFSLRLLYHVLDSSDWDIYTGARLGASYWWSNGSADSYDFFSLANLHAGSVYPSAQYILGGRYLWHNWLGLHLEGGFGSPYVVAAGISINFAHTKSAAAAIGEAYRAELQPVARKNIIKIQLTSLALIPALSWERHLGNRFSVEAGFSLQLKNSPLQGADFYSEAGRLYEADSLSQVIKGYAMLRYYVSAKKHAFPQGWYTGLLASYSQRQTLVHVEDKSASPDPRNFDYEKESTFIAGGLVIGYQHLFGKRLSLDVHAGGRAGSTELEPFRYSDTAVTDTDFLERFGRHGLGAVPDIQYVVCKITVGYAF